MRQKTLQLQARYNFYKVLAVGLLFMAALFVLLISIYGKLFVIGRPLLNKLEELCGCANHLSFSNHPYLFSGLLIFGLAGLFLIFKSSWKISRFRKNTRAFIKINLNKKKKSISAKLEKTADEIGLGGRVDEISESEAIVFCYGFLRPRICISAGMVNKLTGSELRAVLLHEKQHLLVYEPAKIMVVKILEKCLFFLPGFKSLAEQYIIYSELAADELATNGFSQKLPLAQALAKVIDWEEQLILRKHLAISFFSAALDERVNKLTNDSYVPKSKFFTKKFLATSASLLVVIFMLGVFLFFSGQVWASHDGQCAMAGPREEPTHFDQCLMEPASQSCQMDYSLATLSCSE